MAFYFDGKPELRTSYGNQRQLAARDLGPGTQCIHWATLADGCDVCRASGTPLVRQPLTWAERILWMP